MWLGLLFVLGCLWSPFASAGVAAGTAAPAGSLRSLAPADPCGTWSGGGTRTTFDVAIGGETYKVPVRLPTGKGPRPAVILLHGGAGTGLSMVTKSGYDDVVSSTNAILVSPDAAMVTRMAGGASERRWNSGKFQDGVDARFSRDDVAFLDAIARELRSSACVDRVLVTGFSAGGAMANRWLCEGHDAPNAMVTAAGTLNVPASACSAGAKPAPVRLYVGDRDPRSGSANAKAPKAGTPELTVPQTAAIWASRNACSEATKSVTLSPDATCTEWVGCAAPVELCVIRGFPHAWPRGPSGEPSCQTDVGAGGYAWLDAVTRPAPKTRR